MRDTETRAFFGDGEYSFCLTPPMIEELERSLNTAVGAIYGRLTRREFSYREVSETIRLGLVGGGMIPQRAVEMVATYVAPFPLMQSAALALSIMLALFFGNAALGEGEGAVND